MPCILVAASDTESALLALVENLQRRDLDFLEEAVALRRLIVQHGLSQEEAARKVGKSQSAVANKLRLLKLAPEVLEAVKEARGFGDLSENFEYKAAKQEKNRNESRIRFLENMIRTAVVISDQSGSDQVGLYDKVTVYMEDDDEEEVYQIVTTMRQDALKGSSARSPRWGAACWAAGWGTGYTFRSTRTTAMTR